MSETPGRFSMSRRSSVLKMRLVPSTNAVMPYSGTSSRIKAVSVCRCKSRMAAMRSGSARMAQRSGCRQLLRINTLLSKPDRELLARSGTSGFIWCGLRSDCIFMQMLYTVNSTAKNAQETAQILPRRGRRWCHSMENTNFGRDWNTPGSAPVSA